MSTAGGEKAGVPPHTSLSLLSLPSPRMASPWTERFLKGKPTEAERPEKSPHLEPPRCLAGWGWQAKGGGRWAGASGLSPAPSFSLQKAPQLAEEAVSPDGGPHSLSELLPAISVF